MTPRRITEAPAGSWRAAEYSSVYPFSVGNKYLIFQHGGAGYGLYSGDGEFIHSLAIGHNQEPRWDSHEENVLYYVKGNAICRFDVRGVPLLLHTFSEYVDYTPEERNGISGFGEGDCEGNLIALSGLRPTGQRDVFLFDVKHLRKSAVLTLEPYRANSFDQLYATPAGNCLIGWKGQGEGRFQGVELYDSEMQFQRQLASVLGHMDVGAYQGDDVMVWCSSADPAINRNAAVRVDMQGNRELLAGFDWRYAFHVSSGDGFSLVSTYAPSNELPSQVWKVLHDNSDAELLCETGSTMIRTANGLAYGPQPRASLSRDGSRFVFNSNGGDVSRDPDYCDVYLGILEEPSKPAPVPITGETRIDYAPYVGQQFVLRLKSDLTLTPRSDGSVDFFGVADIVQRKKQ